MRERPASAENSPSTTPKSWASTALDTVVASAPQKTGSGWTSRCRKKGQSKWIVARGIDHTGLHLEQVGNRVHLPPLENALHRAVRIHRLNRLLDVVAEHGVVLADGDADGNGIDRGHRELERGWSPRDVVKDDG